MNYESYESGPYCVHWRDPSDCDKCFEEKAQPLVDKSIEAERAAIIKLVGEVCADLPSACAVVQAISARRYE